MARKHIAGVAVVTVALALTGCSASNNSASGGEPSGDITVLTNRTDLVDTTFKDYKKAFEKKYPKVNVKFEAITDYEGEVTTRLSTGDYGDVLGIPASVTPSQLPQFFEPLGDTSDMKKKYRFLNDKSYDGKQYGLPTFGNANGILYNKRIWKEAGVTDLPKTPDEFIADLKLIKEKTDAIPYYTNYKDGWPLGSWQGQQGFSGDTGVVTDRDKSDAPWSKGSEQYITDALLFDVVKDKLSEDDPTTTAWEGSKALIGSGKAATAVLGSWAISQFQQAAKDAGADPADIGYMPFPYQKDGEFHSAIGGDFNNAININSKNKVAARAWVDWFTNDSGFAQSQGAIPAQVDAPNPSTLQDFTDAKVKLVELDKAANPSLDSDIYNKAQIDLFGNVYRQKLVDIARGAADGDMNSYFSQLNKEWADARTKVKS
ncbi:carbohydrate ABC transporter substrate-binding protein [Glaciibacter flavus]|uniref:Carbohydrate ABC transporter substrate-binding protein n=1 Tax=Orlajensenia flava TaxID=2565934 RepID=A0A4V3WT33_9MICO|nr:ABC transporter substrate-binding protein [Glaciibacter flavus]THG30417.1 carbohydrate ABC transporter substrate-binding protein [Glaciibacter flavus]